MNLFFEKILTRIYLFSDRINLKLFKLAIKKKISGRNSKDIRIYGKFDLIHAGRLKIKDNIAINHGAYLNAAGGLEIGSGVVISAHAKIVSTGLDLKKLKANSQSITPHLDQKIILGDGCWIGVGAIILAGVELTGRNIVVAAGAVVTKSFSEDNIILGGCPAKIIKRY